MTARCDATPDRPEVRVDRFPGGCVTVERRFDGGSRALEAELSRSLDYTARTALIAYVEDEFDLALCGRDVSCPG
jgi:hypothetical protein